MYDRRFAVPVTAQGSPYTTVPQTDMAAGLVACPVPAMIGAGSISATVAGIYRLAYEQARAAETPSIYDVANAICLN
jgi:hypothetical protein